MKSLTVTCATVFACLLFGQADAQTAYSFVPLSPCRAVDTRQPNGPLGGPALPASTLRTFPIKGTCGVPSIAKAVTAVVTAVSPTQGGFFGLFPSNVTYPGISVLNFVANTAGTANGVVVMLGPDPNDLSAAYGTASGSGTSHLVLDITGYYK